MEGDIVKFKCKLSKVVFESDNFKVYGVVPTRGKVKVNQYGNVTLKGDLPSMLSKTEYYVEAIERNDRYGQSYEVVNIKLDKPATMEETYNFLVNIITRKQTNALLSVYPNILEMIENKEEPDLSKVKGVKQKTWKKIKDKVVENLHLIDLVSYFNGIISMSTIKKLYDKYSNIEVVKREIIRDPYKCLCSISGIGFKTADTDILNLAAKKKELFGYDVRTSAQRCKSAMLYTLSQCEDDGNTRMSLIEVRTGVATYAPESLDNFASVLKGDMNKVRDKDFKIIKTDDNVWISRFYTYSIEKNNAKMINEVLTANNRWDIDYTKYYKAGNVELTDEQKSVLKSVCDNNFSVLIGVAGAGKSMTIRALINMLEENGKTYTLMTPTGKSAKVLSGYTFRAASTIHKALFMMENRGIKCFDEDIIIVDECSMVDNKLFNNLMTHINTKKQKVLLVGDAYQLPSVGCGNILHDLVNCGKVPVVQLTKAFRYSDDGIIRVATDARMSKPFLVEDDKINNFGDNCHFYQTDKDKAIKDMLHVYKELLASRYKPKDILVLSPYRVSGLGSNEINNYLQKIVNKNNRDKRMLKYGDVTYRVGDIVMQNVNNYHSRIADSVDDDNNYEETLISNGETGVIKEINDNGKEAIISFGGNDIVYDKSEFNTITLGYACTIHKSQGSSAKVVVLLLTKNFTYVLNSNLIYTGITRSSEKVFCLCDNKTVNWKVTEKANFKRNTNLIDMINEIA